MTQQSRPHLVHGKAYPLLLLALVVALGVVITVGITLGTVGLETGQVWRILGHHLLSLGSPADPIDDTIVWDQRAPRVFLALITGAGLSVAGAVLQAVVRNPLAEPYILGVSSGASAAAVAVLTLGAAAVGGFSVSAAAFAGAMATLALVLVLGRRRGRLAPNRLLLAGVAIGYLMQAVTSYLQIKASPDRLAGVVFWLLGSLAGAHWDQLALPAVIVVACTAALVLQARRMNLLLLGDDAAAALGANLTRLRIGLLVTAALLTGAVISVAGGIGFVGLIIPHIVRLVVGSEHRKLLPVTALTGACYLALVDVLARVTSDTELPLGILTAVVGVPFLLWLLRRPEGRSV
ncbi:FecCD family ABC transporter permease [Amycolatopsis anabasis]|uniref:FecCD family ABC transporter permease n=1 Tax=Amycolatopsis anabasis TaxID=1840409 RepID=UPI001C5535E1|nr:iron ABC transporter permease [Amycolatopsis anabasis]